VRRPSIATTPIPSSPKSLGSGTARLNSPKSAALLTPAICAAMLTFDQVHLFVALAEEAEQLLGPARVHRQMCWVLVLLRCCAGGVIYPFDDL
jgi:hypothetical protein